jgi:hypothetical protein
MPIRSAGVTVTTQMVGTWPDYPQIRSFQPAHGRFLTRADVEGMERVVVLGNTIAERLFGGAEQALGREVQVFRARFRVVGVMEPKGRDLTGTDQDEQTFLPLSTYMRRAANQTWISGAYLRLAEGADVELAREAARRIMRQRHHLEGKKDDFSVLTPADAMELRREALDLVQTLGAITSVISFAVGAMGILSIMVLMVQARRMEIGIRRAVGGSRGQIIRQFLLGGGHHGWHAAGCSAWRPHMFWWRLLCARVAGFPYVFEPLFTLATLGGLCGAGPCGRSIPGQAGRQHRDSGRAFGLGRVSPQELAAPVPTPGAYSPCAAPKGPDPGAWRPACGAAGAGSLRLQPPAASTTGQGGDAPFAQAAAGRPEVGASGVRVGRSERMSVDTGRHFFVSSAWPMRASSCSSERAFPVPPSIKAFEPLRMVTTRAAAHPHPPRRCSAIGRQGSHTTRQGGTTALPERCGQGRAA